MGKSDILKAEGGELHGKREHILLMFIFKHFKRFSKMPSVVLTPLSCVISARQFSFSAVDDIERSVTV